MSEPGFEPEEELEVARDFASLLLRSLIRPQRRREGAALVPTGRWIAFLVGARQGEVLVLETREEAVDLLLASAERFLERNPEAP